MATASGRKLPCTIGRYTLLSKIAQGGMAAVFRGRLDGIGGFSRVVAVKCMHRHIAGEPKFEAMFLDEARIAARIRHPNVVPTLDAFADEGELFLVMEYVEGESLARLLVATNRKNEIPVPVHVAVAVALGMLHGLHGAHEARDDEGKALSVIHRDVSPQNVMVGRDGVVRVLDFGISKALGSGGHTLSGELRGKPAYMAPEQLTARSGVPVTRQADIYAAAIVLWELLTASRMRPNDVRAILSASSLPALPPSRVLEGIPRALDDIVLRGLARELGERWQTAKEMADALEACEKPATVSEVAAWVARLVDPEVPPQAGRLREAHVDPEVPPQAGRLREAHVDPEVPPQAGRLREAHVDDDTAESRPSVGAAPPPSVDPAPPPPQEATAALPTVEPVLLTLAIEPPLLPIPIPVPTPHSARHGMPAAPSSARSEMPDPSSRLPRSIAVLAPLLVLLVLLAGVVLVLRGSKPSPPESPVLAETPVVTTGVVTSSTDEPAPRAPAEPVTAPQASQSSAAALVSPTGDHRRTPHPPLRPARASVASTSSAPSGDARCAIPYYFDSDGVKRFKEGCLH